MERRSVVSWVAGVVLAAALGVAGWAAFLRPDANECYACNRPVHAHSRTAATAGGRSRTFCCPACALSLRQQAGTPVTITSLTSYLTGRPLAPEDAYAVVGSSVNMCSHAQEVVDADKQPAGLLYDRCAPSIIAFASRAEADRFSREHGGEVTPFREVAAGASR